MKKTIKKLPKSQLQIEVSIPEDTFESYREKTIKNIGEEMEIDGFRKGKAPMHMVEKNLKPLALLEEMAQSAIAEHLPKIFVEEKIDAIGRPMIQITKIAEKNPLEFTAIVSVFPETKLPDYKKLAAKINKDKKEITVTDEELNKAITELKKVKAHRDIHKDEDNDAPEVAEHVHEELNSIDASITDEEAKMFGPFENAEEFKNKFRESIKLEEEAREREKNRVAILEDILKDTEMEVPEILVEGEMENLIGRLKMDIEKAGLSFEDYLNHIKKTEEEVRADFLPDAEKRAKMELVMGKIGETENLVAKEEEIEREVKKLMEMYEGADANRARAYVTHLLSNEEIFRFLESQE